MGTKILRGYVCFFALCLMMTLVAVSITVYTVEAKSSSLVLTFATNTPPPPSHQSMSVDYFQKRVAELSKGTITFKNYWFSSLLGGQEMLDGIASGVADIGLAGTPQNQKKFPLSAFNYYFPFKSSDPVMMAKAVRKVYDTIPELTQEAKNNNLKTLWLQGNAAMNLQTTTPVRTLEELKGKKIATVGPMVRLVEAGGGVPVDMPGPDRYVGMQRGTIDGQILDSNSITGEKHHEVAKYYTKTDVVGCLFGGTHAFINLDVWNSLRSDQQDIMMQAGQETEAWFARYNADQTADSDATMKEAGVNIYTMSKEEQAKWAAHCPDTPAEWAKKVEAKGLPGWKIVDTFIKYCEDEGYSWPRRWGAR